MKLTVKGFSTTALALLFLLGSCASEAPWDKDGDTAGRIALNVSPDGNVNRSTRADETVSPVIPSPDEFSISLISSDESYSKTWSSPASFNSEAGFPIGTYRLSADYGNIEEEGFSNPYFKGETEVSVRVGEESTTTVTASLANSMVSIQYSDDFKAMFPKYHALLTSDGHATPQILAQGETRPVYMSPRQIRFSLSLTNQQGKEITVVPAIFNAQPRHHYVIVVGVDEKIGVSTLSVEFDENVVRDVTEIPLTDELFTTQPPVITANTDASTQINAFEYLPLKNLNPEFHVVAMGGIKRATLSVEASDGGEAPFSTVELVNAGVIEQTILANCGVECSGFFRNPDKMGVVNLAKFSQSLKPGKYRISLNVEDLQTRTPDESEIPTVEIVVGEVNVEVEKMSAPKFLTDRIELLVKSNVADVTDNMTFNVDGASANVLSIDNVSAEGSEQYDYKVVLKRPAGKIEDGKCIIEATYGRKNPMNLALDVEMPAYSMEVDAFAKKAKVKVSCEDPEALKYIVANATVKNGTMILSGASVKRDANANIIEILNLNPNTKYSNCGLRLGKNYTVVNPLDEFTTESDTDFTNPTFSDKSAEKSFSNIQVGSQYKNSATKPYYTITSDIIYKNPSGWATVNDLTAYTGAKNLNTWYVVPSTLYLDNTLTLRSVGYNHNGKTLDVSGGNGNTNYYGRTSPTDADLLTASGEVFLGTYSFNGSESREEGIPFNSRPEYVKVSYSYSSYNGEDGEVIVKVIGDDNEILSESKISLTHHLTPVSVQIPCKYGFGKKAKKIYVSLKSTKSGTPPKVKIPQGDELYEPGGTGLFTTWNRKIAANSYHALATGSVLTLYSVNAGYDTTK